MSVIIEPDALRAALAYAPPAKGRNLESATLYCRLETKGSGLEIVTTDLEYTAVTYAETLGDLEPSCVVASSLLSLAKLSSGPMVLTPTDGRMTVESENSTHRVPTFTVGRFPSVPRIAAEPCFIRGATLHRMIECTIFAVANPDEERHRGLQFLHVAVEGGQLRVVASDTKRMPIATAEGVGIGADFSILLPRTSADLFARFASQHELVALTADLNHVKICAAIPEAAPHQAPVPDESAGAIYSRISAEQFPAFEKLLAIELPESATVDVDVLRMGIKRANVFAQNDRGVRAQQLWTFSGEELRIESRIPGEGDCVETVPLVIGPAEAVSVAVSGTQMLNFLEHTLASRVVIRFKDEATILRLAPDVRGSFDYTYLAMPVRWDYTPSAEVKLLPPRRKGKASKKESAE